MTKAQKKQRIESIRALFASKGYVANRWGHYKVNGYNFKFKSNVLRVESPGGMRLRSYKFTDKDSIGDINNILTRIAAL